VLNNTFWALSIAMSQCVVHIPPNVCLPTVPFKPQPWAKLDKTHLSVSQLPK